MGSAGSSRASHTAESSGRVRRIHAAEESFDYLPDDPDELKAELIKTRIRVKAAESVIDQLGESDDPVEQRLSDLLERTANEIERLDTEGRERVERIVAEAEALRELAHKQNEKATEIARSQVEKQAQDLLKDADALTASAQARANKMIEDATRNRENTEKYVDELLAEAERLYRTVEQKAERAGSELADAREKASEVMRNANQAARQSREEAEASARRIVENARTEAAGIIKAAKDDARRRLEQISRSRSSESPEGRPG